MDIRQDIGGFAVKYIMAIDQGTTSSRCILFDNDGKICASAQKEFTQIYPRPSWVEHDALEILDSVLSVAKSAMEKLGITHDDIAAIGITNQRETTVMWDKDTGKPICNAIVWQCRRTSDIVERLIADGKSEMIRSKTGLVPDAYFSGTKIKWLLDNVPGARALAESGKLLFGTVDSWLVWNLTGGKAHVTDYTNASRTMIFNIHTLEWDDELLELLSIPRSILPSVVPSSGICGYTEEKIFGGKIPIAGIAGDQQCALFGQCCYTPGDLKNTYGTGCFMLMNTGSTPVDSKNGLITTIAASTADKIEYALEGSVFIAGAALQWLRDELNILETTPESEKYALSVDDTAEGYVVPAFTGIGAPYWNQRARGAIVGITRGFSKAHLIRATLESLAYQTYDIVRSMEADSGIAITSLNVDGGASQNDFLMQFQSDITGADVCRPECVETTALGAAYLAGLAVGYFDSREDILKKRAVNKAFTPSMVTSRRDALVSGWHRAVRCALSWADDNE